ncbi:MAG: LysR substrate-binding domain-containing protein [Burkholderiales bacterium]|nr:LysR substrate-binding domain-containing protein [Burkholderiales bacterium]
MNLRQLEYFVRVAEAGSFSRAAMILEVAQPALSRQVRLLEAGLRTTLLSRTGRGVALTEAGRRLFEHGVAILERLAEARRDLETGRGEPAGHIVVALPPTLAATLAVPLVEAFARELPRARLAIVEGFSRHLAEWVATGRADLAAIYEPEPHAALETVPVRREPLCLVSPAPAARGAHRRPTARAVRFDALGRFPLVLPERAHTFRRLLEAQAARRGLKLSVAWEMSGVHAILELVRAGYGHAVLTESAVLASGDPARYRVRPLVAPRIFAALHLAVAAHRAATPLRARALRLLQALLEADNRLR